MKNIEQKTAQTILEKATEIQIEGQTYKVAPPRLGTLILLSEQIADIPFEEIEKSHSISDFLKWVKHSRKIAKGLAILILGAENILFSEDLSEKETAPKPLEQKIKGFFCKEKNKEREVKKPQDDIDWLTEKIICQMEISQMVTTFISLLGQTHIADFFVLITFLKDTNLLNPTRKVNETTAFGQLSVDL